ncbi:hypothetical protein [Terrisporobacter petrolearius]
MIIAKNVKVSVQRGIIYNVNSSGYVEVKYVFGGIERNENIIEYERYKDL